VLRQPQRSTAARNQRWRRRAANGSVPDLMTLAAGVEALLATAQPSGRIPFGLASVHGQTVDSPPVYVLLRPAQRQSAQELPFTRPAIQTVCFPAPLVETAASAKRRRANCEL
jgi:hypothetical protein